MLSSKVYRTLEIIILVITIVISSVILVVDFTQIPSHSELFFTDSETYGLAIENFNISNELKIANENISISPIITLFRIENDANYFIPLYSGNFMTDKTFSFMFTNSSRFSTTAYLKELNKTFNIKTGALDSAFPIL